MSMISGMTGSWIFEFLVPRSLTMTRLIRIVWKGNVPGHPTILANPSHPEFDEIRSWHDKSFDPEMFDLRATNRILSVAFPDGDV
jgi:hypothetical protein